MLNQKKVLSIGARIVTEKWSRFWDKNSGGTNSSEGAVRFFDLDEVRSEKIAMHISSLRAKAGRRGCSIEKRKID